MLSMPATASAILALGLLFGGREIIHGPIPPPPSVSGQAAGRIAPGSIPPPRLPAGHGHGHASAYAHVGGHGHIESGFILPPRPGLPWGFKGDAPDGYGWYDTSYRLPIGGDRTATYYFPRQFAVPADTMFFPTYFNHYVSRGQRYIPYVGCGGLHPAGGAPPASARLPVNPYQEGSRSEPVIDAPQLRGEVEAPPIPPGSEDYLD